ncbi:MAG: hypothetical protein R2867_37880 [Caldilineaceae bacterium]
MVAEAATATVPRRASSHAVPDHPQANNEAFTAVEIGGSMADARVSA